MSFKDDVIATSDIAECFKSGLTAIERSYRRYFRCQETRKIEGSVNIDECLRSLYASENRWDYVIGYDGHSYFVEVHGASTSDVSTMIAKKNSLSSWLRSQSSPLLEKPHSFHWITTKRVVIRKGSPQYNQLSDSGIKGPKKICECKGE